MSVSLLLTLALVPGSGWAQDVAPVPPAAEASAESAAAPARDQDENQDQDPDEEADREAALFGTPTEDDEADREAALFGTPTGDEADREAALFGTPAEGEEADREAALFGGATTDTTAPPASTVSPASGAGPMGEPLTSTADIDRRLGSADQRLTVGGQLWLRADVRVDGQDDGLLDAALSSPSFIDLFTDARPNDRVRAYARVRAYHDFTAPDEPVEGGLFGTQERTTVLLDQLWIKGDAWRKVYLTVGQQRIKWGAGRFWNPTDFLNRQRLDPLAVFDQRTGVALLKAHIPVGTANLYAIANLDRPYHDRDTGELIDTDGDGVPDATETVRTGPDLQHVGAAVRAEVLLGTAELSASAAVRKNAPLRLGMDASGALWLLDWRLEAAVSKGVKTPFYEEPIDFSGQFPAFPEELDRSDDWIPQVVAGLDTTVRLGDEDTLTVGVEGFFNDAGYADGAELYSALIFGGAFEPFYLGRFYSGAYVFLPGPGRWDDTTFSASWIGNLSDNSHVARLDVSVLALTFLSLNTYVAGHFGEVGEFRYRLRVPSIPSVLDDGLFVPVPVVDVGMGARISF